eukprot:602487-Hanusia_phi.AAC.2
MARAARGIWGGRWWWGTPPDLYKGWLGAEGDEIFRTGWVGGWGWGGLHYQRMHGRDTAGRWLTMLAILWGCSMTSASPSAPVEASEGGRASWLITRSPLPGPSGRSTLASWREAVYWQRVKEVVVGDEENWGERGASEKEVKQETRAKSKDLSILLKKEKEPK